MSASGFIVLVAFLIGGAVFVLWPFIVARWSAGDETDSAPTLPTISKSAQLQAEHEALLKTIRDLDFDFQTGQVVAEDYQAEREALMQRGVEILEQIDAEAAETSEAIEAAVRARRNAS